jgi:triphosphoribosyl-dephospho-CoA synthase
MDPGEFARVACLWEVNARKVGNVHRLRDFADLRFTDFVQSALAIAPVFAQACQKSVGDTILEAIRATHLAVGTNTNLGIVLLLAPLAAVEQNEPLATGLERVLNSFTLADSRKVFAAIRLAQPGGLGQAPQQNVYEEPTLPLRAVMALAAERDLIARQYANGYREVLEEGVPCLHRTLGAAKLPFCVGSIPRTLNEETGDHSFLVLEDAIILTHLNFLAHHSDSLIVRKAGLATAQEVSRRAAAVLAAPKPDRSQTIAELDAWLVANHFNPGTSADLVTASLFIALREGIVITGEQ